MSEYGLELHEDYIRRDETGRITHHPLNSVYRHIDGSDMVSYGYLTFCGHDLDKSSILDDLKVFYLVFYGETEEEHFREEWADTLRAEVLLHLSSKSKCWYLSMINGEFEKISETLANICGTRLNGIEVSSEKKFGYGYGFISRPFFEVPNEYLLTVIEFFWSKAVPGHPIEGYNLDIGNLDQLRKWNNSPRDDHLFREVIDQSFICFYTHPSEHCHFAFITNKINYSQLAKLICLDQLQRKAKILGK